MRTDCAFRICIFKPEIDKIWKKGAQQPSFKDLAIARITIAIFVFRVSSINTLVKESIEARKKLNVRMYCFIQA